MNVHRASAVKRVTPIHDMGLATVEGSDSVSYVNDSFVSVFRGVVKKVVYHAKLSCTWRR